MDKCPKCNMDLKEKTKCEYCGYDVTNVEENKVKKQSDNKVFFVILALITIILSLGGSYFIVTMSKGKNLQTVRSSVDYGNLTIKDEGISAPVSKVYDSVVVVETYYNDRLYATGTGFVFKEDEKYGYILTNHHVIEDGTSFKVKFTDDEEADAKIVGSDKYVDTAVLKVDKKYILSVATMGSSEKTTVGDTTFTIGSPVDAEMYSWTVTRGILSGKDRIVEVKDTNGTYVMNVIQTDAAINNGNSGGPLCNANGEVIGVTNLKLSSSSIEGIGFAIPIEVALEYAENFISGKPIIRPYLGIVMYNMGNLMFGYEDGVYIREVEKDSPADKAGLKAGDVIVGIDGKDVSSTAYLKYWLYKHNIGDEITIAYKRNGSEKETKLTLGSFDVRG